MQISENPWKSNSTIHHECSDEWHNTTIGMQPISNGTHTMLTNTISDVRASVSSESSAGWLEVDSTLNLGQVTACQIGRTTHEIGERWRDRRENKLGQLARRLSRIGWLVHGESLLPSFWELSRNPASEFCMLFGVCLSVLGEKACPLGLELGAAKCSCLVSIVGCLRHVELLVRGESKLGLQGFNVIGLES